MKNLRLFYVYTNADHDVYAIPYEHLKSINVFACQVFIYNKRNDFIKDAGTYFYIHDGRCPGTITEKHVTVMVSINNLQPKIKKVIIDWKKSFKKGNKYE